MIETFYYRILLERRKLQKKEKEQTWMKFNEIQIWVKKEEEERDEM